MDRHFSHMLIGHLLQSKDDLTTVFRIFSEIFGDYVQDGQVQRTVDIINDPNTRNLILPNVINDPDSTDQGRLVAEIIRRKKYKQTRQNSAKTPRLDKPHDRLILLR